MTPTIAPSRPRPPGSARGGPPAGLPRLLPDGPVADRPSLARHLERLGPLPAPGGLVDQVDQAGLRGRGGAGFPTAVKLRAVRSAAGRRRPVVVANGTESEPLSHKDVTLLGHVPHLVLDGMVAAAVAVGAGRAVLCLKEGSGATAPVRRALVERSGLDPVDLEVVEVPARYVSGEESALVNHLNTGRALPTVTPPRPAQRGVGGRPTLVDNVETLANLALIARFGPSWWRSVGTTEDPGSMLVTVSGGVAHPGLQEVALGTPLPEILGRAGAGPAAGILVGGYFGTWLTPAQISGATFGWTGLAPLGAAPGCGALTVLPETCCPLAELSRVADWLAGQSAGQCGACTNGLPAIAGALARVVRGDPDGAALGLVRRWAAMVRGRGACKLPDGAVAFVLSGLEAFAPHLAVHRDGPGCEMTGHQALLPTPQWRTS